MAGKGYDRKRLRADLVRLGLRAGDTVIVHSSMRSIGWVRGGPRTVIGALQDVVTRAGAILMPTFSYSFERIYSASAPYDAATSPSQTGLLTETFRKCPGVVRSGHPTHSVAAWGRSAKELTDGHEGMAGLDADSPFGRAARRRAKVCLIGCDFTALSLLHVAEAVAESPYLGIFGWWSIGSKPTALIREKGGRILKVGYPSVPGCSRSFGRVEPLARKAGILRTGQVGDAMTLVFGAEPLLELAVRRLRRRPDCLLCPPAACRACDERRTVFERSSSPGASAVGGLISEIVEKAGIRLAGGEGERKAAEIISQRMASAGLSNVRVLEFPVLAWQPGFSAVELRLGGRWIHVPSAPVSHSPATSGRAITGRLVHLESFAEMPKILNSRASVAVLWDGCGRSAEQFRRLMDAGFKAFVCVDNGNAHDDLVAVGAPARWLRHLKTPMASIPYLSAIRLFGQGADACRIRVGGERVRGKSTVVVGEITGRGRDAILVTGHHDSTFNSPAPDDNLSGVAAMLRIAEVLRSLQGSKRAWRTIRFCSFGAEEQLSEGARWYAFESGEAEDVRFVLNNDSAGARVGATGVHVTGPSALADWVSRRAKRSPLQFRIAEDVSPFSDQFPFNTKGAPSLWFYRRTTAGGRHYHHTVRDGLAEVSFEYIARLAEFEARLIRELACVKRWPFPTRFPAELKSQLAEARRDWLK